MTLVEQQECFAALDAIWEAGTNTMIGGADYLVGRFGIKRSQAQETTNTWHKRREARTA
jgi:hypothetical protein